MQKPLLSRYSSFEVTTYATLTGALMLSGFAPALPSAVANASGQALAAVLFLGVGASATGFCARAYANGRLPVSGAASLLYAVPPVAILIGWIWLGESPAPTSLIGGAVCIVGALLTTGSLAESPGLRRQWARA